MATEIDFYFDFSSSYSYVALPGVAKLAAREDVSIRWKPFLLGVIFKAQGHAPPGGDDAKMAYMGRDLQRRAAGAGLPAFTAPSPFPFNGITAMRAFWFLDASDNNRAVEWARAVFNASFAAGRDCSKTETLAEIAAALGLDAQELLSGAATDAAKEKLKVITAEAMDRGVFGAPTFFAGDEMFWGGDRLSDVERYVDNL